MEWVLGTGTSANQILRQTHHARMTRRICGLSGPKTRPMDGCQGDCRNGLPVPFPTTSPSNVPFDKAGKESNVANSKPRPVLYRGAGPRCFSCSLKVRPKNCSSQSALSGTAERRWRQQRARATRKPGWRRSRSSSTENGPSEERRADSCQPSRCGGPECPSEWPGLDRGQLGRFSFAAARVNPALAALAVLLSLIGPRTCAWLSTTAYAGCLRHRGDGSRLARSGAPKWRRRPSPLADSATLEVACSARIRHRTICLRSEP
jgi:hypothetical protein